MKRKTKSKPQEKPQPIGRPSMFTPELAVILCDRISKGESLRKIAEEEAMPSTTTVLRWLDQDEAFRGQYMRARAMQAMLWAEELLEISDDGRNDYYKDDEGRKRTDYDVIARSRLRIDTRKWMLSKMLPKVYGDKLTTEVSGPGGGPVQIDAGFDASKLSPDEREALRALVLKARGE